MKLIATLGATKVENKHIYKKEEIEYSEYFSFLALQKHYNIPNKNVYILGTNVTKKVLGEYIKDFNFIKLEDNNLEEIFQKSVEIIEDGDILDLTQSFRLLSFGVFLGVNFLSDNVQVFYAQLQRSDCNYTKEICEHKFVSLDKYIQIGSLAKEINTFISSWYLIENNIPHFSIHKHLNNISKKLLVNDIDIKDEIIFIKKEINFLKNDKFEYLNRHLDLLDKEILKIELALLNPKDSIKFFRMANLYFEKNLLLQTLTMLFESITAFVADKTVDEFECRKKDKVFTKKSDKYYFRNCLKAKLSIVRYNKKIPSYIFKYIKIDNLEIFAKQLVKIDEMRNNSAHAFIQGKGLEDYKNEIQNLILFFKEYING